MFIYKIRKPGTIQPVLEKKNTEFKTVDKATGNHSIPSEEDMAIHI